MPWHLACLKMLLRCQSKSYRVFIRSSLGEKKPIFLFDINCSFVGRLGVSVFMSCAKLLMCVFAFPA